MQPTFKALGLNIFQKKLKRSSVTQMQQQILIKYKQSIMCGYFCIAFIAFMLKGRGYADLFPPDVYQKNDKVISKHIQ